jgi:signal transduction histidine kinase
MNLSYLKNAHVLSEKVRLFIANELHDDIGGRLGALTLTLSPENFANQEVQKTANHLINDISDKVRDFTRILYPNTLNIGGLYYALNDIKKVNEHIPKPKIEVKWIGNYRYEEETEIHCYRIIQESLNNIRKHSDATFCKVIVEMSKTGITIKIIDDGIPFNPQQSKEDSEGLGLINIKSRIAILSADYIYNYAEKKNIQGFKIYQKPIP